MSGELATKFEDQLPKAPKFSFGVFFNYVAGFVSLLGVFATSIFITDPNSISFIYISALTIITLSLFVYIHLLRRRKLHRYAQSVIFTHYINHRIRDALKEKPDNTHIEYLTVKLLNAIATCFSIITGTRCRSCIVELKPDFELTVVARDEISIISDKKEEKKHYLKDNTDFEDLWYAKNGCSRYFLCNDLIKLWHKAKYKNSSFNEVGEPKIEYLLGILPRVKNWKLPYKSALVLPIRYIESFHPPKKQAPDKLNNSRNSRWNYWGFLCIDCNSMNKFDDLYCPELGGGIADSLFTLFSQYQSNINAKIKTDEQQPSK